MKDVLLAKIALSAVVFGSFFQAASAQEALSLSQSIDLAMQQNYAVQIAQRNADIAQNNNEWGTAGRYPNINLTLGLNNVFNDANNPASFTREITTLNTGVTPGIEAVWTLYNGNRVNLTKRQLEQLERVGQGNVRIAVENTIRSVILAYYATLIEQERLEIRRQSLVLSRDRVNYESIRQEFGRASTFDVLQNQDAYLNDSTLFLQQGIANENALRNLNLALGVDDLNKRYELTDRLDFVAVNYNSEALQTAMLANNQLLQNLYLNRDLSSSNTRIQESAKFPSLSLRAGGAYNSSISNGSATLSSRDSLGQPNILDLDAVQNNSLNFFLNFSVAYNLFDGGVRKRNIENAKTGELIAQLEVENLKRTLNTQLANTIASYNNQKQLLELTNQLVDNAQRNLDIAGERFRGGLISSFDYRTVQLGYINATQGRLNALFNLKNIETELLQLAGGLLK
ncbi:MAG: TolC family protein [Saprospiraceae bacterium]|nr:TolC family protein [Saprospiraceae bacterium]MDZ4702746.1 TolC family protein [Saprospiraceae bacterium]